MGTNYYILTQNKKLKEAYFPNYSDYRLTDEPDFGYQIHICKKSGGWKTLFQEHRNAYDSVSGLEKFIIKYKNDFLFYDECFKLYSAEEFIDKIKHLDRNTKGELYTWNGYPLNNHKDCEKNYSNEYGYKHMNITYREDDAGYDFTSREFS